MKEIKRVPVFLKHSVCPHLTLTNVKYDVQVLFCFWGFKCSFLYQ